MNTARVISFVLSDLETGQAVGHALTCPDARYTSIAWAGADELERRWVEAADWRMLVSALGVGLPSGPLPADHIIVRILFDAGKRRSFIVQSLADAEIPLEPLKAAGQLDDHLRGLAR